jgi:hypothetical protein
VLLVLGLLAPGAAGAEPPTPVLTSSTALAPQLEALATPSVRSRSLAGQAEALGLPSEGVGALVRQGGRVIVEARFEAGAAAAVQAVRAAGASVIDVSRRYQTLVLAVAPADLQALAAVPGITEVTPSQAPEAAGLGGGDTAAISSNGLCEGGSVITQGIQQLKVDLARTEFDTRGAGETIGIISDSFDSATVGGNDGPIATKAHDDEVTNDLPGKASTCSGQGLPVQVIAESPPGMTPPPGDEGRAMLQIVHDLAPHAKLAFATGNPAEISYAQNIEKLAAPVSAGGAGANVIVDDFAYPGEPMFQEGPVGEAVRRVTEKGVLYFTAAGNDNSIDPAGNDVSSWEAPAFRGSSECNAVVVATLDQALPEEGAAGPYEPDCMDFDPGPGIDTEFGITVQAHGVLNVELQWAEPWFGVKSDLFAFLLGPGSEENLLAAQGTASLPTAPSLLVSWENTLPVPQTVRLAIPRCSGPGCNPEASATADPRLKFILLEDGYGVSATEYPTSAGGDVVGPAIHGHRGSPFATTVGAVGYRESSTAPRAPEAYSSRGPVTHYFGPIDGIVPAAPLKAPEVIQKPDVTATDCASTTFFSELWPNEGWHFCGSSEAAEHAGTIAALMQQTAPLATAADILSRLRTTTTKFTVVDAPEAVGTGMVNAQAALKALGGAPVEDPPSHVVSSIEEEEKAGPPEVRITNGPRALGNESRPTFAFSSSRPVAFTCQLDGGTPQPCASPYLVPSKLADGSHGFAVTGKDAQGRSAASGVYDFTVDTKAPRTKFVSHPKKVVKTGKRSVLAHFKVRANESPVTFFCQFDKEPLRICPALFRHRFTKGRHAVRIRAKDGAGNLAEKPTVFHFRVKARQKKHPAKAHHRR